MYRVYMLQPCNEGTNFLMYYHAYYAGEVFEKVHYYLSEVFYNIPQEMFK
jgi:hypothetical protein